MSCFVFFQSFEQPCLLEMKHTQSIIVGRCAKFRHLPMKYMSRVSHHDSIYIFPHIFPNNTRDFPFCPILWVKHHRITIHMKIWLSYIYICICMYIILLHMNHNIFCTTTSGHDFTEKSQAPGKTARRYRSRCPTFRLQNVSRKTDSNDNICYLDMESPSNNISRYLCYFSLIQKRNSSPIISNNN